MKVKKHQFLIIFSSLLLTLLILNVFQSKSFAEEEEVTEKLGNRAFKEEVNLGEPATGAVLTSAVFGEENGRDVGYTTANGGVFSAIDVVDNEVLFTEKLEGISTVWSHSIASDGTVYIAGLGEDSKGTLWSYSPENKSVTKHGVPDDSHQFWSSTTDDSGNVYVGTYKEEEGKIFKYDPDEDEFTDFGKVDTEGDSSYVRSLAYHDGYLYAGLGVTGSVYKIDVDKPMEKEDITKNVPEILDMSQEEMGFAYDMAVAEDYLVVRFGDAAAILLYDLEKEEWVEDLVLGMKDGGSKEADGSLGFNQLPVHNNNIYITNQEEVLEVDLETLQAKETNISNGVAWKGLSFVDFGDEDEEKLRLTTFQRQGNLLTLDIEDQTKESLELVLSGDEPLDLHNLGLGPDGNLYMTTYPGGPKGAQYNTKTGEFESYAQGQAEGMIAGNDTDMFFGIYSGADIQKMNTDTLETESLFNLHDEYEQDRPYIMKFENDKLLIGTIPDYGKLGGTLTIYDPETEERETHRNVVEDHSVVGLASKDGKIYGSTSIHGGLDIEPTADNAKMFVWDIEEQKKITDFEIDLPGLDKSPIISGLTFDDEGLLWGAVDGFIFAMDSDTFEIVKHKNIYPEITNHGKWRPVHIHFGDDGLLYTDVGSKLSVVDPESEDLDHVTLVDSDDEVSFMELAYDSEDNQNIYYIDEKNYLKMIPVVEDDKSPEEPEKLEIVEATELNSLEVDYGTLKEDVDLPEKVKATLSDSSNIKVPVIWEDSDPVYDEETAGKYEFTGELDVSSLEDVVNSNNVTVKLDVKVATNYLLLQPIILI